MLRNHLKIALRNLFKQKGFSAISIIGLSVALAVAMLMLLWVNEEWQTDKFHANTDRLYMVKRTIPLAGGALDVYGSTPYPILKTAVEELPEVERLFTLGGIGERMIVRKDQEVRAEVTFANEGYFESFSFPLIAGSVTSFDEQAESIVISEKVARQLFGELSLDAIIGEPLEVYGYNTYTIVAVFKDYPSRSSLQTDVIFSFSQYVTDNEWMEGWTNTGMRGGLLLSEGADLALVQQKVDQLYRERQEGENKEGILLQPYADNYLYSLFDEQAQVSGGRITYVRIFGFAAFALLLISCINFVNLATARASIRAKEVGIRKTVGAPKSALISQFMIEAGLVASISVVVGLVLAQAALPQLQLMAEKSLQFNFQSPLFWLSLVGMALLTTILSGAYPAFALSAFQPVNVLKGKQINRGRKVNLRQVLVIAQFSLSLLLIVSALTVRQQVAYIQNKNLGLDKENVIVLSRTGEVADKFDIVQQQLLQEPGIASVTASSASPMEMSSSTTGVSWEGKRTDQSNQSFAILWVQQNFPEFFGMEMIAGTFYRPDQQRDTTSLVLNESAIAAMELEDPVGKVIQFWENPHQIVGVVKDFHNGSMHEAIRPMILLLNSEQTSTYYVKTKPNQAALALRSLEATYGAVIPDVPFHYEFLDEEFQQLHANDKLVGQLAQYFALLSIFLSCLGLFGLAAFLARQRTKEIGVRKVLGASVWSIVNFLLKDFIKLVVIAVLIATPLAWYFMDNWLAGFAYHTELHWWLIALAGLVAIGVAVLTVSFESIKAALANPVDSLRSE